MKGSSDAERLLVSLANHPDPDPDALRALIKATRLLGLTCGAQLVEYRNSGEPLQVAFADVRRLALLARCYEAVSRILAERWHKIPERRRPHYTPHLRFQILELKSLLGLSPERNRSALCDLEKHGGPLGAGGGDKSRRRNRGLARPSQPSGPTLCRCRPPSRPYHALCRFRRLQADRADSRSGWLERSPNAPSGEWSKKNLPKPPFPKDQPSRLELSALAIPITSGWPTSPTIPSLFRLFSFKLVVVLDVFSRMPLTAKVFWKEPSARQMCRLIQRAALRFGEVDPVF